MIPSDQRSRAAALPSSAWAAPIVIAIVVFGLHLGNGFVWDDHGFIESNPAITGADSWGTALTREAWYAASEGLGAHTLYYRPLFVAVLRLLWAAGGGAPWVFHLASLALHLLNGTLALAALRRLGASRGIAFAAAALLLVHPLAGEVVYWASTIGEELLLSGLLVALLAAARAREAPASLRALQAAVLAGSAVAVLSKETGVIVPLVVTIEALCAPRAEWRSRLRVAWPAWPPAAAFLAIRFAVLPAPDATLVLDGLGRRAARAGEILAWDLRRLVVPLPSSPLHALDEPGAAATALGIATLAALGVGLVALARRRPRELFWVAWLLLPLLPPIAQVFLSGSTEFPVAERYLFLSLLPALVLEARLAAWIARRLAPRHAAGALPAAAAVALAGAGFFTARYGTAFADDEAYFSRTLAVYPDQPLALMSMGNAALARGDLAAALPLFAASVRREPRRAAAHANLGSVLRRLGRLDEALASLTDAVRLDGRLVPARLARADALRDLGRVDEAGTEYAAAVAIAPANAEARLNLGTYLFLRGDVPGAVAHWEAGVSSHPGSCELLFNLAMGYAALGRRGDARSSAERFLAACRAGFDAERAQAAAWAAP